MDGWAIAEAEVDKTCSASATVLKMMILAKYSLIFDVSFGKFSVLFVFELNSKYWDSSGGKLGLNQQP